MESRLCSVLLAAALLSGCSWFHRGDKHPQQVVVDDPGAEPTIIEPQVNRRVVKTPKINAEDFFLEGFLARSKSGQSSLEETFPAITVLSNSGRYFTYYDLDVGYNILPGEVFLGRGRAFNTALYVLVGIGDVKFADQDQFAINFGIGTRILITDWLALHLDVRDHVFEDNLFGVDENVHNIEGTLSLTTFF